MLLLNYTPLNQEECMGSSTPLGTSWDSAFLPFTSPHLNEIRVKVEALGHTVAPPYYTYYEKSSSNL